MHLFGTIGTFLFIIGFFFAAYLGASKLYMVHQLEYSRLITNRPSFYISLTCMIIGSQMFLAGFISELVARNAYERNHYLIEEKINNE